MNDEEKAAQLSSHPFPVRLTRSKCGMQICRALTLLEAHLASNSHDKILLLLERWWIDDFSTAAVERLLRYTQCQRVMLLVSPTRKAKVIESWERAVSWEDGRKLREQFSVVSMPQDAQMAQICIVTVFDIQVQIGIDSRNPFFTSFDVIVLDDVSPNAGPGWYQIVDIFTSMDTNVVGLSSLLSVEEGELFFDCVIDAISASNHKLNRA